MEIMEVNQVKYELTKKFIETLSKKSKWVGGINEVTKAIERKNALLVLVASDVNPIEIVMHIPPLCKGLDIKRVIMPDSLELGKLIGLTRSRRASCCALVKGSSADIEALNKLFEEL